MQPRSTCARTRGNRSASPQASACCWGCCCHGAELRHSFMDDSSYQGNDRPASGLLQSLSNFAATIVAIAHTRLELLTTELQEEVRQVGAILIWAFVAAFAAMMGLFLGALAVIFVFWDEHRITAALAMV